MIDSKLVLFYVASPAASEAFYADLLGAKAIESSPTFAMFRFDSGLMFGLWDKDGVEPAATPVGGSEICFGMKDEAEVRSTFESWKGKGLKIVQEPVRLDFGFTFVALDPDGHRLRVYVPM
jgi:catechol 2,3-dioxygenase-like lactoylglutathione lyase family enzyme